MPGLKDLIPGEVASVLERLRECGIGAFPVGGCVRDMQMGKTPHDFDIAAEAVPSELTEIFRDFHTVDNGIKFGTLTVISGKYPVEITCCRSEGAYRDLRRPDSVEYTRNIAADLARRDFTVNAMAMDADGEIIDLYGGLDDLDGKIIRAVGDAEVRFREDALRILRALRFSSVLDFEIEKNTSDAIHKCRHLLSGIAAERIFTEMEKMLLGKGIFRVLTDYSDVICEIIPELSVCVGFEQRSIYHIYDVYTHIAHTVENIAPSPELRFTMLLHDVAKPPCCTESEDGHRHFYGHPDMSADMSKIIMKRLCSGNELADKVEKLVRYHDVRPAPQRKSIIRYLSEVGFEDAKLLTEIRRADTMAQAEEHCRRTLVEIGKAAEIIEMLESEKLCLSQKDLAVNGNDIAALGIPEGKEIGVILKMLLDAVIEEKVANEKEPLIKYAMKIIS